MRKRLSDAEKYKRYSTELENVLRAAHRDGMEMAGWLSAVLCQVASELPGKTEELLEQRPGSWEAAAVRQLCGPVSCMDD
jgi:hypothetical protein